MKLRSIHPYDLNLPSVLGGRINVQPGDIFEIEERIGNNLCANEQAIELVEGQPEPTMKIRYVGIAELRHIAALDLTVPRDVYFDAPLWLARYFLEHDPGSFRRA